MSIYETLRTAVLGRKSCKISKPGEAERKICPYLVGKSKEGQVNVLYYQYDGYSSRGLREDGSSANSRCNRISEIATAEIVIEPSRQPIQKTKSPTTCVLSFDA